MILFAVLAGMALIAVLCVLVPLLRRHEAPRPRAEHDIAIYRDQLAELERDRDRGLLAESHLETSRSEIGRRLLAADAARHEAEEGPPPVRAALAVVLAAVLPLAAGGLYFWQGAPPIPAGPAPEAAAEQGADMATLVRQLAERLDDRPGNPEGWRLLGRSLASLERYGEAAEAYGRAAALLPADAGLKALRGEALVAAAGGTVAPEAAQEFARALALDPGEPRARFYLGLAALQRGDPDDALARWRALEAASPEGAEWLPMLRRRIASLASQPSVPAGPTREEVAAAGEMEAGERAEMIRGMVERLALRLKDEPDDAEGWARLAHSYRVLGEAKKERGALASLARLLPEDSPARAEIDRRIEALDKGQR